jgi:hypothetical protein
LPINKDDIKLSIKESIGKKKSSSRKTSKKIKKENYYENTCKLKSIIGLCLNIIFWIWLFFYILDYLNIIIFLRKPTNKRVRMIYAGNNSDSFIMGVLSTLFATIFNHFIPQIYPEALLIIFYCVYISYSLYNTKKEKFKEDSLLLSRNTYIILVILGFGELYKLVARKYLDI